MQRRWSKFETCRVHHLSALELLTRLPPGVAGAVILDPPAQLGIGKSEDKTPVEEAIAVYTSLAEETARVLRLGGAAIVLGEGHTVTGWEVTSAWAGLQLAAEMVVLWDRETDRRRTGDVVSLTTGVRWYVKPGYRYTLNVPRKIRIAQTAESAESGIRVASNVIVCRSRRGGGASVGGRGSGANGVRRPVELFNYFISLFTEPEDLVVVPFCRSGSALVAAEMCGRAWLGCDRSEAQCRRAKRRVKDIEIEESEMRDLYLWRRGRLEKIAG